MKNKLDVWSVNLIVSLGILIITFIVNQLIWKINIKYIDYMFLYFLIWIVFNQANLLRKEKERKKKK